MKRLTMLLAIVLALCFCITGCGNSTDTASSSTPSDTLSVENNSSKETPSVESSSEATSSKEETMVDGWRTHPEDFKLIALTYDDVPSFSNTNGNATVRIIDAVSRYEGRSTLFVVGQKLSNNGNSLLQYAVEKGFELGNHTYTHTSVLSSETGKQWTAVDNYNDFKKCNDLVEAQMNIKMKYLRPAGVHTNEALYQAAEALGLPCVSGNCKKAVSDYAEETTPDMIVERVLANAFDGAIILLHGHKDRTADATEQICEILYNDGYRFCTVDELFRFKGYSYEDLPSGVMLYGVNPETGELIVDKEYK